MNALLAILNVFIDPDETVRRIEGNRTAWVLPVLIGGLIMGFHQWNMAHFTFEALRMDPPSGIDPAALEKMQGTMETTSRFAAIMAPVMWALMALITSALVFAGCMITETNIKFPALFGLVAHTNLIKSLQLIAHYVVMKSKGEVNSMRELMPSFGLEMFLPEGTNRMVYGATAFFSVFNVWHIVILAFGFAALAKTSKAKAFAITAPDWIIGLLFAIIGALMMRS